jgi:hypothetical protein
MPALSKDELLQALEEVDPEWLDSEEATRQPGPWSEAGDAEVDHDM